MTRVAWALLLLGLFGVGFFAGAASGTAAGVARGTALADWEWARMLENGMVGPGTTHHPLRVPDLPTIGD